ncbi:MAG: SDR family oxidoreductase [Lentisphaerae bacterium]|nr:SDR family oxidoreductase [Lentisphaerota bacterium]
MTCNLQLSGVYYPELKYGNISGYCRNQWCLLKEKVFNGVEIMTEFSGRTAMITGGASGMGLLTGEKLAEQGANVALLDVNEEALAAAEEKIKAAGGKVIALKVDIRKYAEVEAAEKRIVETFGSLDILINAAGGMSGRCCGDCTSFEKLPIEVIDWGLDVNLRGAIYCCRAVLAGMMERKRGVIINFGSVTGEEGGGGPSLDYSAEKSAMKGMTKSLAILGAPHNVRSCCVIPGPVLTRPGMARMKTLLGRAAEPIELVDFILYLCSDKAAFITGSSHLIDGGRLLVR